MTTEPEEKLLAAIREEENDFTEALQEANDILYPDPAKALAAAISERKTAVREWKDCLKRCDALAADLAAIGGMIGRPTAPIVDAVRQAFDDEREIKKDLRQQRDAASRWIGQIAVALGLSEYAPAVAVHDRAKDLRSERDALAAERDKSRAALRRPALPADMRAHLEKVRNAVLALGCDEAEVAAIDRWLALPTAEVAK